MTEYQNNKKNMKKTFLKSALLHLIHIVNDEKFFEVNIFPFKISTTPISRETKKETQILGFHLCKTKYHRYLTITLFHFFLFEVSLSKPTY